MTTIVHVLRSYSENDKKTELLEIAFFEYNQLN